MQRNGRSQVDHDDHIFTVQFAWNGQLKPVSSMFVGTSPEFELALYTLCFLAGQESNEVTLAGYRIRIKWVARLGCWCWCWWCCCLLDLHVSGAAV